MYVDLKIIYGKLFLWGEIQDKIFCNVAIKLVQFQPLNLLRSSASFVMLWTLRYTSLMLSNLPSASINELKQANHEPIVRYAFVTRSLIRDNLQN